MFDLKSAVMTGLRKVEMRDKSVPEITDDEVLVKIENVGVCGSDLHFYEHGRIGDCVVTPPFVLGHEAGGTISKVGKNVKGLKIGDRVALEPGKTCGKCEFCKSGKYNLCKEVKFFATPPIDGVFQEYVAHEASLCFKIPDNMDTVEAALIEPLSVGIHAAEQANAQMGHKAVVMGAGCIGLVCVLALKARGVSEIFVVDVIEKRLNKALELGATHVINGKDNDAVAEIIKLTNGSGTDIVIETAGTSFTSSQSIKMAKKGSVIVFVGYSSDGNITIPMGTAIDKELNFKTVFRYRNIYPKAIEAVSTGKINIKNIVTNTFDFDDIQDALEACTINKADIVKAVIQM